MSAPEPILRVRDRQGRGPWRPGFSHTWTDAWRTGLPAPVYQEVAGFKGLVAEAHRAGMHIGCAARGIKGLFLWVSPTELWRIADLGFRVVDASSCEVLAETPNQILIASKNPLRKLPTVDLGRAA